MAPLKTKEIIVILDSLKDVLPVLGPIKAAIELTGTSIEQVSDNKSQCLYLLRRCTNLCLHVNQLCLENKSRGVAEEYAKPLGELKKYVVIAMYILGDH
jgi:hypothetical protein